MEEKGRDRKAYLVKPARLQEQLCNQLVSSLLLGVGCVRGRIGQGALLGMGEVRCGQSGGLAFGQAVGSRGVVGIGLRRCRSRGGTLTYWEGGWRHLGARCCGELASVG